MIELGEEIAGQVSVLQEHVDLGGRDQPHLVLERRVGGEHAHHRREELPDGAAEHRLGEALLAPEVVVHEGVVHSRLARDLRHARARGPTAHEDGVRRVEDAGLGVGVQRRLDDLVR